MANPPMSQMWNKTPQELVEILGKGHGDTESYGDWGLHVSAILQAKVTEQSAREARSLVKATWWLVTATLVVALATVAAVWVSL